MKTIPLARPTQPALSVAGATRPSLPVSAYGEDFSLLVRKPKRLRVTRWTIRVLS